MVLGGCCYERRAHLTPMHLLPKGQVPYWGVKSVTVVQSTIPGTLGNLTSHLCWAWLAGSGWEYMQGLSQQMTERSHF